MCKAPFHNSKKGFKTFPIDIHRCSPHFIKQCPGFAPGHCLSFIILTFDFQSIDGHLQMPQSKVSLHPDGDLADTMHSATGRMHVPNVA